MKKQLIQRHEDSAQSGTSSLMPLCNAFYQLVNIVERDNVVYWKTKRKIKNDRQHRNHQ